MAKTGLISELITPDPTPQAVWQTLRPDWLICEKHAQDESTSANWFALVEHRRHQLEAIATPKESSDFSSPPLLLISESNPTYFLANLWAALLSDWNIALANPHWGTQEWQSVFKHLHPTLIAQNNTLCPPTPPLTPTPHSLPPTPHSLPPTLYPLPESATYCPSVAKRVSPTLLIPTGGTSGQIKFTRHTWSTLLASVVGFCQTFQAHFSGEGSSLINSYCVLPLYHVSGLMQTLRSALSGGQIVLSSFKALESSPPLVSQPSDWFISLVPTQLSRLLNAGQADWLSQFRAVLLGGAPAWSTLLAEAQTQSIPLCLSYGMTETAAMVTVLSPQDFLQGRRGAGKAMPHATVQIEQAGQQVDVGEVGQVVIRSEAIAQNYYNTPSEQFSDQTFYTDDLGYLDADGYFHITGRASEKIISGGENIFPAEVEAALRKTNQVLDVCVLGLPHPDWGEVVVAVYVPVNETVSPATLKAALTHLSRYKHPKRWFSVSALPRNAQGKLNRSMVLEQLASLSSESAQA